VHLGGTVGRALIVGDHAPASLHPAIEGFDENDEFSADAANRAGVN
jgi:hypothetical protein